MKTDADLLATQKTDLISCFYSGNYNLVISEMDSALKGRNVSSEEILAIIGSLSFTGRVLEAETLFEAKKSKLRKGSRSGCRFFLAIAHIRKFNWSESKKLLFENKKESPSNLVSQFYTYQGFAIYRHYHRQARSTFVFARRSLQLASQSGFLYGRTLALDLLGHIYIQMGEIPKALSSFKDATQAASQIGNHGLKDTIYNTYIVYKIRFGFSAENAVSILKKKSQIQRPKTIFRKAICFSLSLGS